MKFKYFLRGLGCGIIFSAVICLTAYLSSPESKISDQEVIRRAKTLGMVEQEDKVGDLLEKNASEEDSGTNSKQEDKQLSEEVSTKETVSQESTDDTLQTTQEKQSNSTEEKESNSSEETEKTTEDKKADSLAKDDNNDKTSKETEETVKITVERGASSFPVCQKLQELGMIKDASEFDTYLIENGYASKIRVGEHTLKKGMSFHDIAEAISDQP